MIGRGSFSHSEIQPGVIVGNYCSIASGCEIMGPDENHLCKFNKKCVFTTSWDTPEGNPEAKIGNDVWIGKGTIILPGVVIGDGVIIGAGSVITDNIPPYAIVCGNPGRVIKFRFTPEQIRTLLRIRWWEWDDDIVTKRREDMKDIDLFIKKYG